MRGADEPQTKLFGLCVRRRPHSGGPSAVHDSRAGQSDPHRFLASVVISGTLRANANHRESITCDAPTATGKR